mmetsp:Transcript_45678/g.126799  ORF Transcript_45678/g.126799 Transcript_45678/m.126799 type:complete len:88 (-) Transcript_45678:998-1261(-)
MEALILTLRVQLIGPILRSDLELLYKQAGWVLACLAVDPLLSTNLVEGGVLPLLVHYAEKDHEGYQEEAAWALANLSSSSEYALPNG